MTLGLRSLPRSVWWATAVGVLLRVIWAVAATRTPAIGSTDAALYLRMANELAHLDSPTFGGRPADYYAIGYPLLISPLVALGSVTGWFGAAAAAAGLNVLAGAATIPVLALLGRRVFGGRAGIVSAWLLALAPSHVLFVATATTEVTVTFLLVSGATLLVATVPRLAEEASSARAQRVLLATGVLAGLAVVIRSSGLVLLVLPFVVGVWSGLGWRTALRSTLVVGIGACVFLVPVLVRNGVEAGYWSPLNSSNAATFCMGNHDSATGVYTQTTSDMVRICLRGSPWTNDVSLDRAMLTPAERRFLGAQRLPEAEWYRRTTERTVSWILEHPERQLELVPWRAIGVLGSDKDALLISLNADGSRLPGDEATRVVRVVADGWATAVMAIAILGLVRVPQVRRARVLWFAAFVVVLPVLTSLGMSHYDFPAQPFLVVLAAGTISAVGTVSAAGTRRATAPGSAAP